MLTEIQDWPKQGCDDSLMATGEELRALSVGDRVSVTGLPAGKMRLDDYL